MLVLLKRFVPRLIRITVKNGLGFNEAIRPLVRKYCVGRGLEIGAGKAPYCDPSHTVFLDKFTDNKDGTPKPDIVADADRIPVPDAAFDYVFSSHVLEHMPNTIKALQEWLRVLRPSGILFVVLPHGDRTLDRLRRKTTLEHHFADANNLIDGQTDRSHDDEIKEGWSKLPEFPRLAEEFEKEWGAPVWDFEFRHRNGVIHFHVWTQDELVRLLQHLHLTILAVIEQTPERYDSFVVVARRP